MKVEFTERELAVVEALMDAGIKAVGKQAILPEVLSVFDKFAQAKQAPTDKVVDNG